MQFFIQIAIKVKGINKFNAAIDIVIFSYITISVFNESYVFIEPLVTIVKISLIFATVHFFVLKRSHEESFRTFWQYTKYGFILGVAFMYFNAYTEYQNMLQEIQIQEMAAKITKFKIIEI